METERKTIRIRKSLVLKIDELAVKENRNFNNMVETLLMKSVEFPDLVLSLKEKQCVPLGHSH